MVNLPAFLSLTRPHLSDVPVLLYFHENQLTYPLPEDRSRERAYPNINYLSALAADRLVFNSEFHVEEFADALPLLLRDFPDFTNLHTVQQIRDKSQVLHLGMDLRAHDEYDTERTARSAGEPLVVLWNQRWEYDKNPEAFFRTMNRLDDAGYDFRLILAGKHFREQPEEFERAFERYAERILHYGYAEDFAEYSRLLHRADLVVSTSIHEFFGVAIQEAIYCGCHPLLPNRLSYPELIPDSLHRPLLHAPVLYEDDDELYEHLAALLGGDERPLPTATLRDIPERLDWSNHIENYDALFESVAEREAVEV
jgi:glycosyltransferase involved in cell wall biosynthesis